MPGRRREDPEGLHVGAITGAAVIPLSARGETKACVCDLEAAAGQPAGWPAETPSSHGWPPAVWVRQNPDISQLQPLAVWVH